MSTPGRVNRPNSSPKLSSLLNQLARAAPLVIIHAVSERFSVEESSSPEAFQVLALHILAAQCLLAGV